MNDLVFKSPKNNPVTSSLLVAEKFNKDHKHVLEAIRNLMAENSAAKYFYETIYTTRGKQYPQYIMDRDGFSLLVMGFTGKEALSFKISFIEAFNAMEKQLKSLQTPQTFAEALQLAADQAKQIEIMQPKAKFYDTVTNSKNAIDIGSAAKVINLGFGRNKLFEKLRNMNILMSDNKPYQRYIDSGYFRIVETKYDKPDGSTHISLKTLVYQKGLDFIIKKLSNG